MRPVASSPEMEHPGWDHDVLFVPDDSWTENSLTWSTQPAVGPTPSAFARHEGTPRLGDEVWDVTDLVRQEQQGDGVLSLRLSLRYERTANHRDRLHQWLSREGGVGFRLDLSFLEQPQVPVADDLLLLAIDRETGAQEQVIDGLPEESTTLAAEAAGTWLVGTASGWILRGSPRAVTPATPRRDEQRPS